MSLPEVVSIVRAFPVDRLHVTERRSGTTTTARAKARLNAESIRFVRQDNI